MILVNHGSATILPETVPVFAALMKMKEEMSVSFYVENGKRILKRNKLIDYLLIVSMCALKCFIILQICGIN